MQGMCKFFKREAEMSIRDNIEKERRIMEGATGNAKKEFCIKKEGGGTDIIIDCWRRHMLAARALAAKWHHQKMM